MMEENISSSTESAASLAVPTATWPNLQDTLQFEKAATAILNDRPHTISSGTKKTAYFFTLWVHNNLLLVIVSSLIHLRKVGILCILDSVIV